MNEEQFKGLSEDQRKAEQRRLQEIGLYPAGARIDGKWGPATKAAFQLQQTRQSETEAKARQDALEQQRLEIERMKAQSGARQIEAEAERLTAETEARKRYDEQASSNLGLGTSVAASAVAPLAGVAAGRSMGGGINRLMDVSQERKNASLAAAANDRLKGLTTREGARIGTTVSGAMPEQKSWRRVGGRMLPHLVTGGFMAAKGGAMLGMGNEDDPYYTDMANRAAGLGMIGAGTGILERGANYAVAPGVSPDARSISIIESNQLRRKTEATARKASNQGTLASLRQEARDIQLPNRSRYKTKSELQGALERFKKSSKAIPKSGILAPLAAGALAYDATRSPAHAGQGGSQAEALGNAAAAGGIAAGTGYGINRAIRAAGPAARGIVSSSMAGLAPMGIDAMTDYSPEKVNEARNIAARYFPEALQFGAIARAREMAQIPQRNPNFEQALADFQALIQEQ